MVFSRQSHSSAKNLNQDIQMDPSEQHKTFDNSRQVREAATSPVLEPRGIAIKDPSKPELNIRSDLVKIL